MSDYLRLEQQPEFVLHYPTCGTCAVDLDTDGDGWTCPSCGSMWDNHASEGDKGELYESWSGEAIAGDALTEEEARDISWRRQREERDRFLADLRARAASR